jgi:type II secretory pathway component GspD/PulD (secretin)
VASGGPAGKASSWAGRDEPADLEFAFERRPWRDVIDWLAENADLSLYVGSLPTGSLTLADSQKYTPDQAIERINRFLIPMEYTLIRSGKMLSVIGLQDGHRDQILDALAEYSDLADLDRRGDNEVVKCIFTIAKADPQEAMAEISGLVTMSTLRLLPKSRQLLVIETAAKLRMIRSTLASLESPGEDAGPVRRFALNHVTASDVLTAVRPLVGIADDVNIGPDISLSGSADGTLVFGTGSAAKLAILEGVVQMLDRSPTELGAKTPPTLRTHLVSKGNLQAVEDVLQTLLSGEDVRLAQEPQTGRIVVLASEGIHQRVEETIAKLAGESAVFDIIQLKSVETYVAMSLILEMFDIPYFSDEEDEGKDHPRLDWESFSKRIFIRGTQKQVDGEVLIFPPAEDNPGDVIERELKEAPNAPPSKTQPAPLPRTLETRILETRDATNSVPAIASLTSTIYAEQTGEASPREGASRNDGPASDGLAIKAQVTPRGILLHSTNPELLRRFEEHLLAIAGPGALSESKMAIFYLQHVRANEAKSLLTDIRTGEPYEYSSFDSKCDSPSSSRSSFSVPSVIADTRLNRLIVQGTVMEIAQIEKHLRLIDRDKSITDVQFRGKPHIVSLTYARAFAAAAIIRSAYAHELQAEGPAPATKEQQQQQQYQYQYQYQYQPWPTQPGQLPGTVANSPQKQSAPAGRADPRSQGAARPGEDRDRPAASAARESKGQYPRLSHRSATLATQVGYGDNVAPPTSHLSLAGDWLRVVGRFKPLPHGLRAAKTAGLW